MGNKLDLHEVHLTELASCAGCAAKLAPGALAALLSPLTDMFKAADYPALLVGLQAPDDAAVYRINDQQAIISTVDFFPPVVDDPYAFGAIAAANAMSDVYAMGGDVLFALNLAAFPENLDPAILSEILRGGADRVMAAGGAVVGGHTIKDDEPKFGLAVTGIVAPDKIMTKGGAQSGDVLILTKPLGVGVITTALKRGHATPADVDSAISSMMTLNRKASLVAREARGVHAMTDITGYSLLGHGHEMAHLSNADFIIDYPALEWLPGAQRYANEGNFPGGAATNVEYFGQWVALDERFDEAMRTLLFTPETSGGLLMAVSPGEAENLLNALHQRGVNARQIGYVEPGQGRLRVNA
jgi:selenide, water dikinase